MRELVGICICMIIIFIIIPTTSAQINLNEIKKESTNQQIDSGLMIGIMHIYHIKKGWGWIEIWQPVLILIHRSNGRIFLGPLSGTFTPQDFKGFIGPNYFIHSHLLGDGFFFICANVKID